VTYSQSSTSCFFSVKGNCDTRRLSDDLLSFSWIIRDDKFICYKSSSESVICHNLSTYQRKISYKQKNYQLLVLWVGVGNRFIVVVKWIQDCPIWNEQVSNISNASEINFSWKIEFQGLDWLKTHINSYQGHSQFKNKSYNQGGKFQTNTYNFLTFLCMKIQIMGPPCQENEPTFHLVNCNKWQSDRRNWMTPNNRNKVINVFSN